jgi:hypothetical protein
MILADLDLSLSPLPRKPGNRCRQTWFWHEDRALDDMFERGCTDDEMAKALGRTPGSIAERRYSRGLLRIRRYANRRCQDCGAKCSRVDSIRCLSCHHKAQAAGAIENASQYFAMRSEEEILPDGTRRRLYGDLRGL